MRIDNTMLIPAVPPLRTFFACRALIEVEMQLGINCGSSCASMGVIGTACAWIRWTVRTFRANTYGAYGTDTPPRESSGDRHHAISEPDEMIRQE